LGAVSALFWLEAPLAVGVVPVVAFLVAPAPFAGCVLASLPLEVLGAGSLSLATWLATWLATCGFASRPRAVVAAVLLPLAFALPFPVVLLPPIISALVLLLPVELDVVLPPPVAVGPVLLPSAAFEFAAAAVAEPELPEPEPALAPDAWPEGPVGVVAPVVEAGVWAGVCG
jgi:hypothetical protein